MPLNNTRTQRRLDTEITRYEKTSATNDATIRALDAIATTAQACDDEHRGFFTSSGDPIGGDDLDTVLTGVAEQAVTARNEAKARRSAAEVQRGVEPIGKADQVLRWQSMGLTFEVRATGWRKETLYALVRPNGLHSSVNQHRLELNLHHLNKGQHFRIHQALDKFLATCADEASDLRASTAELRDRADAGRRQVGKPFPQLAELEATRTEVDRLKTELESVKAQVNSESGGDTDEFSQNHRILQLASAAYTEPAIRRQLIDVLTVASGPAAVIEVPPRPRLAAAPDMPIGSTTRDTQLDTDAVTSSERAGKPQQPFTTDDALAQPDRDGPETLPVDSPDRTATRREPGATITLTDTTTLSETRAPDTDSRTWIGTHDSGVDILVTCRNSDPAAAPATPAAAVWTYRLSRRTPDGAHLIGEPWSPAERWESATDLLDHLHHHVTAYTPPRAALPAVIATATQELADLRAISDRAANDDPLLVTATGQTVATTSEEAATYLARAVHTATATPLVWRGVDVRIDTIPTNAARLDEVTGPVVIVGTDYRTPLLTDGAAAGGHRIVEVIDEVITHAEPLGRAHEEYLADLTALATDPTQPIHRLPSRPTLAAVSGSTATKYRNTAASMPAPSEPQHQRQDHHEVASAEPVPTAAEPRSHTRQPDPVSDPSNDVEHSQRSADVGRQRRPGTQESADESPGTTRTAGPWSRRIQIQVTGTTAVISGTSANDPSLLRSALKANGFEWKPGEGAVWKFRRRRHGPTRDAAVQAIRDVLVELDREAAAEAAPPAFPPTAQQQAIIEACLEGRNVAVSALAGTGKTSTLRMIAALMPDKDITYLAFNRAIADEAQATFGPNAMADTMHAFAKQALRSGPYQNKLTNVSDKDGFPDEIAAAFSLNPDDEFTYGAAPDERVEVVDLIRLALRAVKRFRESGDPEITTRHLAVDLTQERPHLADLVVDYARRIWADKTSPDGVLRFTHDDYLKIWALGNPRIPGDVIFFDEVQDSNELQATLVQSQPAQIIVVGDSYQSIYGFRGAKDYLSTWPADVNLPLTQSWRFGPAIADTGNLFLRLLNSRLELEGNPALNSMLDTVREPDAVLCRTNAGAVAAVFAGLDAGKRVALVGGAAAITDIAKAANALQRGRRTKHPDLSMFSSWHDVRDYVNKHEDAQSLRTFVRLVDKHGPDGLEAMADSLVDENETNPDFTPDLVVSTAHKAKGREWNVVRIADDFKGPTEDQDTGETILPSAEELRLAYVTVTRAKQQLDPGSLDWILNYANHSAPPELTQSPVRHELVEPSKESTQDAGPRRDTEPRLPQSAPRPTTTDEAQPEPETPGERETLVEAALPTTARGDADARQATSPSDSVLAPTQSHQLTATPTTAEHGPATDASPTTPGRTEAGDVDRLTKDDVPDTQVNGALVQTRRHAWPARWSTAIVTETGELLCSGVDLGEDPAPALARHRRYVAAAPDLLHRYERLVERSTQMRTTVLRAGAPGYQPPEEGRTFAPLHQWLYVGPTEDDEQLTTRLTELGRQPVVAFDTSTQRAVNTALIALAPPGPPQAHQVVAHALAVDPQPRNTAVRLSELADLIELYWVAGPDPDAQHTGTYQQATAHLRAVVDHLVTATADHETLLGARIASQLDAMFDDTVLERAEHALAAGDIPAARERLAWSVDIHNPTRLVDLSAPQALRWLLFGAEDQLPSLVADAVAQDRAAHAADAVTALAEQLRHLAPTDTRLGRVLAGLRIAEIADRLVALGNQITGHQPAPQPDTADAPGHDSVEASAPDPHSAHPDGAAATPAHRPQSSGVSDGNTDHPGPRAESMSPASSRRGFGGRILQLRAHPLADAPVRNGWDTVGAVVDHLVALPCPHPPDAVTETKLWERGRDTLLTAIQRRRAELSPGGTLLAYRDRNTHTKRLSWVVVHAATGHPILTDRDAAQPSRHPTPGRPLHRPEFVDLPNELIPLYLDALERLIDPRGHHADWMQDFTDLQQSLRQWQDFEPDGTLPQPGSMGGASGIAGLHTAAIFHAAATNPALAAEHGALIDAVFAITSDRRERWGHRHAGWVVDAFNTVRRAFGRTDEKRHHDPQQERRSAHTDRKTYATVLLAQARALGGEPHQAIRDLTDRADAISWQDENRPARFSSAQLRHLIPAVAEICSPALTELDRLLTAKVGDRVATIAPGGSAAAGNVWTITSAPRRARADRYTMRVDRLDAAGPIHATLDIDLNEGRLPVRIHYDYAQPDNPADAARPDHHLSRVAAGHWAVLAADQPLPATAAEIDRLSRRAMHAFLAADPDTTHRDNEGQAPETLDLDVRDIAIKEDSTRAIAAGTGTDNPESAPQTGQADLFNSPSTLAAAASAQPHIETPPAADPKDDRDGGSDGNGAEINADIDAIRAAVATLPDGEITEDDLARVGVTQEQFERLVDVDMDAEADEWRANRKAELGAETEWIGYLRATESADTDASERAEPDAATGHDIGEAADANQVSQTPDATAREVAEQFGVTPEHPAVQYVRESIARMPHDAEPEHATADRYRVAAEAVDMYVAAPDGTGAGSLLRSISRRDGAAEAVIPRWLELRPAVEWPHWVRTLHQSSTILRTAGGLDGFAHRTVQVAELLTTRIDALATTPAQFQVQSGAAGVRLLPAGHPAAPPLAHQLTRALHSYRVTREQRDAQDPLKFAIDVLGEPEATADELAERACFGTPHPPLRSWSKVTQLRDLADVAESAGYTTPLGGRDISAPGLLRAIADAVATRITDQPRYERKVAVEVPDVVPIQPRKLYAGETTSPVGRFLAKISDGTAHSEDTDATRMAAENASDASEAMLADLNAADPDRVRRAAAALEDGARDEALLHVSWALDAHRFTGRRGVREAWDVLYQLLWPEPGWDLERVARRMITYGDDSAAHLCGALVAMASAWRARGEAGDDLAKLLTTPAVTTIADQLETVASHLATPRQFNRPPTPRIRMAQASLFDLGTDVTTEKRPTSTSTNPRAAAPTESAVPAMPADGDVHTEHTPVAQTGTTQLSAASRATGVERELEVFEAAVAEAHQALADTKAAGGHHPDAWLRFSEMVRTDPRTGIDYSATQLEWQAVTQWWIQQATTALEDLGYRVEIRAAQGRRRYRKHQIEIDRAAKLVTVDAAVGTGTNAFNLVKQVAALRAETRDPGDPDATRREATTHTADTAPPSVVGSATDRQTGTPDHAADHATAGATEGVGDGTVDPATPARSDDSELSIDEIYAAEGYQLIDGLTAVSELLVAHHWDLVEEQQVEDIGAYTEHWRRHDVSLGVTITPEDRVLTMLFIRHGPWESDAWHEFETDSAQQVRELVQQAGLHGVARPARLPGLWRVEVVTIAADAIIVHADNPTWRLVTRPADAVDEDSWVFADDSTPVPLAPPLPQIAVSTRDDVIKYILGDRHRDKELRRQVQVVLSGRSNKGLYLADAQRQLNVEEPEVYRRALAASAGRPGRKGEQFDVARAQQALERLAEGDPTLPLNSIGQYVEITETDTEADRVPLVGPMPTRTVRGVVVEVTPEYGNKLRVVIERDVTSVTGAPRALQDFPVDAVVTCLDPTQRPSAEELRAAREAMVSAIRERQQGLGIDTTATASADSAGSDPAASPHADTAKKRTRGRSASPSPSDSPVAPDSPDDTVTTYQPATAPRSESTSDGTQMPTTSAGATTRRAGQQGVGADGRQTASPGGSGMAAAALAWWDAGCGVVQVRTDGSKRPVGDGWTRFQQERASREEVTRWFQRGHPGIGIVCGAVSGDLEMFELEGRAVDEHLADALRERMIAAGQADLWERLTRGYVEGSPSGGIHVLYRVEGGVDRNTKLAQREARDDELTNDERTLLRDTGKRARRVLIETRGEGGFVVVAPSHGPVHDSGHPWRRLAGAPARIPTITPAERDALHMAARDLDQIPAPPPIPDPAPRPTRDADRLRPGDDFNERATWRQVLEPHGWIAVGGDNTRTYWRRPGKNTGVSAVSGGDRGDYLWVFSTSTALPNEQALSKWRAYGLLDHAGDFSAAARALSADGYGDRISTTPSGNKPAAGAPARRGRTDAGDVRRPSPAVPRQQDHTDPDNDRPSTSDYVEQQGTSPAPVPDVAGAALVPHVLNTTEPPEPGDAAMVTRHPEIHTAADLSPVLRARENGDQAGWLPLTTAVADIGHQLHIATQSLAQVRGAIRRLWPVATSYGLGLDAALDVDTVADAAGAGVIVHLPRVDTLDRDTTAVVAALKGFRVHSDPIPGTTPIAECVSHRHTSFSDLAGPPFRRDPLDAGQGSGQSSAATTATSSPAPTAAPTGSPVENAVEDPAEDSRRDRFAVAGSRAGRIFDHVDPTAVQTATRLLAEPGNRERAMQTIWAGIPIIDARFPTPVVEIVRDVVYGVTWGEHVDTDLRARATIADGEGLPAATTVAAFALELDGRRRGDDLLAAILQQTDTAEIVNQLHAVADGMAVHGGFEVPGRPSQHALFDMPDTSDRPTESSTARSDSTDRSIGDAAVDAAVADDAGVQTATSAVNEAPQPESVRTTSGVAEAPSHDESGTRGDAAAAHGGTRATAAPSGSGAAASERPPRKTPSRPIGAVDRAPGEPAASEVPAEGSDAGALDPAVADRDTPAAAASPPPSRTVALSPAVETLRNRLPASDAGWPGRLDAFLVAADPFAAQDTLRAITRATDNDPHVQVLVAMAWRAQHGQATTAEVDTFVDRLTAADPSLVGNAVGRNVRDPHTGQLREIQEIRADIEGRVVLRGALADRTVLSTAVDPDVWLDPRGSEILPTARAFPLLDRWTQLCEQARMQGYTVMELPNADVVRHDKQRIEVGADSLAERVTRLTDLVENVTARRDRPNSTSTTASTGPAPADPASTDGTHPPSTAAGEMNSSTPRAQVHAPATTRYPSRPPQPRDAIDRIAIVAADDPASEPLADQLAMRRHTGILRIDEPARLAVSYVLRILRGPAEDAAYLAQTVINVGHRGEAEQIAARLTKLAAKIDAARFTTPIPGGTIPIAAHLRDIATHVRTRLTAARTLQPTAPDAATSRQHESAAAEAGERHTKTVLEESDRHAEGGVTGAQHLTQRRRNVATEVSASRPTAWSSGRQQPGSVEAANDKDTPQNGDGTDHANQRTPETPTEPQPSEPLAVLPTVARTPAPDQATSTYSPRRRASISESGHIAWPTTDLDVEPSRRRPAATEIVTDPGPEPAGELVAPPGSPGPAADNTGTDRADRSTPPALAVSDNGTTEHWLRLREQASRAGYAVVTIYDTSSNADVDEANHIIRISGDQDPMARVVALAHTLGQIDAAGLQTASPGAPRNAPTPRPSPSTQTAPPRERTPMPSPRRAVAYESVEASSPLLPSETPVFDALVRELGWHDLAASLDESRQRRAVASQPAVPQPVAPSLTPAFDRLMHKLGWYDRTDTDTVDRPPAPHRSAQLARHRPSGTTRRPQPPDDLAAVAGMPPGRRSYAAVSTGIDTVGTRGRNGR